MFYDKLIPNTDRRENEFMEKRNIINFIDFIRGCEPREPVDLIEPVREQIALHEKYGIKCTFLLQYDALLMPEYTEMLKKLNKDKYEIGVWFEVVQPLVEAVGLKWKGRFPWDWHADCGFSVGYTKEQRKALIDELFTRFKTIFGYYPKSMGSWAFDASTAAHAYDKYGVCAFCNCKDQWGTDGYTMWGGYYGQGYYPSRMNSFSPAQSGEYQIGAPVFRMLGSDPLYQYDFGLDIGSGEKKAQSVISLEPVYVKKGGGGNPKWVDWYFSENYNNKNLTFSYAQAGQENSFGWHDMKDGYIYQIEKVKELQDKGMLVAERLSDSGEWFQRTFQKTPPSVIAAEIDWENSGKKSVWYDCMNYRANVYADGGSFRVRDLYIFDEKYPERYRNLPCKTEYLQFDNLPVADGNRFSGHGVLAGIYPYEVSEEKESPLVFGEMKYREDGLSAVLTFTDTACGDVELTFDEKSITVKASDKTKNFAFRCTSDAQNKDLPSVENIFGDTLILSYRGFPYSLKLNSGHWSKDLTAYSDDGVLSLVIKGE